MIKSLCNFTIAFIETFTSSGIYKELFFSGFITKRTGAKFGTNTCIIFTDNLFWIIPFLFITTRMGINLMVQLFLVFTL